MKYIIEKEIFEKYPDLRVGIVVGKDLNIKKENPELKELINKNIQIFLNNMEGKELLSIPNIEAWRDAYKSFGVKPKKHKPTAEALLRRVIKGDPFPEINCAVDAYLAVELLYLLPIGGYDLEKIEGDIKLRISNGQEIFFPLGNSEPEYTNEGEVIYADSSNVITRRWNYRDANHTKITENSKQIILASEAVFKQITDDDLKGTIDKIIEYENIFCNGSYKKYFLDIKTQEVEI